MRLFSVLQDDWAALTASRRSRGLGDDNKIRAFFPQTFALLVLSIRRSTTLATAMEARGFGGTGPRSHARVSEVHTRDKVFLVVVPGVAGHRAVPGMAVRHLLLLRQLSSRRLRGVKMGAEKSKV